MPRGKRRSTLAKWLDRAAKWWRYFSDIHYARRSDGARRAAQTRRARRSAVGMDALAAPSPTMAEKTWRIGGGPGIGEPFPDVGGETPIRIEHGPAEKADMTKSHVMDSWTSGISEITHPWEMDPRD